jgi:Rap1a immunity proteins
MRKLSLIIYCAIPLLSLIAKPVYAETTEKVLSDCRAVAQAKVSSDGVLLEPSYESGFCMGAFVVVDQMLMTINATTHKPIFNVCLPSDFTRTQMIAIFVRYAEKHPERYNEDFPWVAFSAAREVFPCGK